MNTAKDPRIVPRHLFLPFEQIPHLNTWMGDPKTNGAMLTTIKSTWNIIIL